MTFNIGDLIVNSYVSGMGGYEPPGERYVYVVRGSRWSEFEEKVLKIKLCPVRSDLQSFYMDLDTVIRHIKSGRFEHYPVKKGKKKCLVP